jgi:peptidoglycan L-alanyl-D-glutamate endopeptidase CwlK
MFRQASLDRLHPVFKVRLQRVLRELRSLGWQPVAQQTIRTAAQQADKVKKGYSKTMRSWHVQSTLGMLPASGHSYYEVRGNAADVVDRRYGWAGPAANKDYKFWKDLGRAAKGQGLTWGGDWKKFRDVAHIELHFIDSPPIDTASA